jgi:hypothetical protein
VEAPLAALVGVTVSAMAYWYWLFHIVDTPTMSGDKWYMRRFAHTEQPVSAPYCWRPLHPLLSRYIGFKAVTLSASLAAPLLIYYWMGGGWRGFFCAMLFVGNSHIVGFNIKSPEYAEGLGQLLMIASVWAMSIGSPIAFPLFLLAALCRETMTASLGLVALFWNPWLLIPLVLGGAASWYSRNEDKDNVHPLVEDTPHDTLLRWVKFKGNGALSYSHVLQPFRGAAIAVPFMWGSVGDFARLGLLGLIPIWLLALPASGQSRIMCYGFAWILPFAGALPIEWVGFLALVTWFWPFDLSVFDETGGGKTFGFAH